MMLDEMNSLGEADFTALLAAIYEHSPWVAARVASLRPFTSIDALAEAMAATVATATDTERRTLVDAHPDLAGRLARAGDLAEASKAEQSALGLDRLSDEEFDRFDALNRAYRTRFGFPFIIAVGRQTRASVLAAFERRLTNDPATELATALTEIDAIARLRLRCLLS
jgi:2-oxo-4-hydroxy-4-carboxy-5-ureidoimidazoline decarboxylase